MKPYIDSTKFLKLILVFVSAILFPSLSHAVNKTIQIKSDISKTGLLSYSGTYSWQTGDFFVWARVSFNRLIFFCLLIHPNRFFV